MPEPAERAVGGRRREGDRSGNCAIRAVFEEDGRTFLFYSFCGEQGIAAAELDAFGTALPGSPALPGLARPQLVCSTAVAMRFGTWPTGMRATSFNVCTFDANTAVVAGRADVDELAVGREGHPFGVLADEHACRSA